MKKVIYSISAVAIALLLISCSSKTSEQTLSADSTVVASTTVDSTVVDSTVVADTLTK